MTRIVLILGSAPNAVEARDWPRGPLSDIVAVNNAWRVRDDWDFLVHPDDFEAPQRPPSLTPQQRRVTSQEYIPIHNDYGGMVYAGGTMAFTAGYWALGALRPDVMAYFGCDMVYAPSGNTHFYGKGAPDPLRQDITLRSLEAKSARLMLLAAQQGCACVNLSQSESRLVFPRADLAGLPACAPVVATAPEAVAAAQAKEAALAYRVPSGKYWKEAERFDPAEIDALDALWLSAAAGAAPG